MRPASLGMDVRMPASPWNSTVRCVACAALWGLGTPALAGDPIVLVGGPPVVADGQNTAVVQIWSPAIGPETKIAVKGAPLVGVPAVDGGDFASFRITPPAAAVAGELQLKVKVSSAEGKGTAVLRVPVVPPDRGEIGIAFDLTQLRHGIDNAVSIRLTMPDGPREAGSQSLEVHSSIGVIDTVTAEEGGKTFLARWRPPKDLEGSQMAVFAVVDKAAPDRVMGTAAYPVLVKKPIELPVASGSSAVLTIGERQFGPLPAGPNGRVRFDVERDPRQTVGRLRIIAADGGITESSVELAFGEGPRFTFVPPPVGALADAEQVVKVTVVAINPDGTPWTGKAPEVKVDRGSVSAVVAASRAGRFVVTYQPDAAPGEVSFTASLDGRSVSRTMDLVAPAQLEARSGAFDPPLLEGTVRDATFTVTGAAPGAVMVGGGAARGRLFGAGPYTQAVRLDGASAQMVAHGGPAVTATGRPVTRLFLWTAERTVQADAVSMVPFVVAAIDDQGQPVPDVELSLTVPVGTGSLPEQVTTGADGLASGLYTVGNQVGPVTLRVAGAGVHTAAPLFLEGAGYTGGELKVTGDTRTLADREQWMSAVAVARTGRPFPAAQPAIAPMTGADIARLEAERKAQEKAARIAARTPPPAPASAPAPAPAPESAPATADADSVAEDASEADAASEAPPASPRPARERPATGGGAASVLARLGAPPPDGLGRSELRVAAHIGAMPRTYEATSEGEGSVPGGAALFETPGLNAPSLDLRGFKWFGTFGAEGRYRYVSQTLAVPFKEDPVQIGGSEVLLGGRMRGALQPGLTWQVGTGFHYQSMSAFVVADDGLTEAEQALAGVRLAGAVTLDRGPFFASNELSGTFSLSPSVLQNELTLGYEVVENISIQGMYALTLRGATVTEDEAEIEVSETIQGYFLGVAYTLP